jgi:hypothetical protein
VSRSRADQEGKFNSKLREVKLRSDFVAATGCRQASQDGRRAAATRDDEKMMMDMRLQRRRADLVLFSGGGFQKTTDSSDR